MAASWGLFRSLLFFQTRKFISCLVGVGLKRWVYKCSDIHLLHYAGFFNRFQTHFEITSLDFLLESDSAFWKLFSFAGLTSCWQVPPKSGSKCQTFTSIGCISNPIGPVTQSTFIYTSQRWHQLVVLNTLMTRDCTKSDQETNAVCVKVLWHRLYWYNWMYPI